MKRWYADPDARCVAVTQAGYRCTRMPDLPSDLCGKHARMDSLPPPGPDQDPATCAWLGCDRLADTEVSDHTRACQPRPVLRFCGEHASQWLRRYPPRDPAPLPDPASLPAVRACAACDRRFVPERASHRYCDTVCTQRAYRDRLAATPERACLHCGEPFRPRSSRQTTCSRRCVANAYTARQREAARRQ